MSVALARFERNDAVVLVRDVSDNARRFLRGETLRVDQAPVDRRYVLADGQGHTIHGVVGHDLVAPGEPLPTGLGLALRRTRSFLSRHLGGTEA